MHFPDAEEIANALTHGLGLLLSVVGLPVLLTRAVLAGSAWHVVSCAVFGTSLVLLYAASTLYHAFPWPRLKRIFMIVDHSAIYLLIAGTYTPFMLVNLRGPWGWSIFGVIWGLALVGIFTKILIADRFLLLSTLVYIAMGWLVVVAWIPVTQALPSLALGLLVAGGVAYTAGTIFFGMRPLPFHHAIWHLFVLLGSVLHFFAVLVAVTPAPGA